MPHCAGAPTQSLAAETNSGPCLPAVGRHGAHRQGLSPHPPCSPQAYCLQTCRWPVEAVMGLAGRLLPHHWDIGGATAVASWGVGAFGSPSLWEPCSPPWCTPGYRLLFLGHVKPQDHMVSLLLCSNSALHSVWRSSALKMGLLVCNLVRYF